MSCRNKIRFKTLVYLVGEKDDEGEQEEKVEQKSIKTKERKRVWVRQDIRQGRERKCG